MRSLKPDILLQLHRCILKGRGTLAGGGVQCAVSLAEPHRGAGRGGRLDALPSRRLALLSEECECYFGGRGEP